MSFPDTRSRSLARIAGAAALAIALLGAGVALGVRSSWAAHHPRTESGTALRVASDVPVGGFIADDGEQIQFRLDDVIWMAGRRTGTDTVPPCLREVGERVRLEATIIELARPFGDGSYDQLVSLVCP